MTTINLTPQAPAASTATQDTPSQSLIKAATHEVETIDSAGRIIVLRRAKPLQKLRFIAAMGENSSNSLWVGTVSALMHVASIDGAAVNTPTTLREIEALYQRLDEHGMTAVYEAGVQLMGGEVDKDEAKK